jgi:hypothetical protein
MIEEYKRKITTEKFFQDGANVKIGNPSDHIAYAEFVRYFKDRPIISLHDLVIGINFTYGWMPTIFEFQSVQFDEAVSILNNTKKGVLPSSTELELLKGLFNNSLVGTSKLLHFVNPNIVAIWDSRVYRYLNGNEPHGYRIGNIESFLDYLKFCEYLIRIEGYNQIHSSIEQKIGYSLSKLRSAELIMYSYGSTGKSR